MDLTPREITLDDTTTLTLTLDGSSTFDIPKLPIPEGIEPLGTSRQQTSFNGKVSTSLLYRLAARRPGEYTFGPYSLEIEGHKQELPALTLRVLPARTLQNNDEAFVTLEAGVDSVLLQQPLQLTLSFFSTDPIEHVTVLDFTPDGFEIGEWQEVAGREQTVNGRRYRVRRFINRLIPTRPGPLSLQPTFLVQVAESGTLSRSPLGLFRGAVNLRSLRLQPQAVTLDVHLPPTEGRPHDYQGLIGRFNLSATSSPDRVQVGDPITLRIQLSGTGAIRQALPPAYTDTDDFRAISPRLIEEDLQRDGLSGRKILEQVLIPKHDQITEIPAISLSFFDPELGRYETRTVGPFPLVVEPAAASTGSASVISSLPLQGGETTLLGEDLLYLKPHPGHLLPPLAPFPLPGLLPLALWALFSLAAAHRERLAADPRACRLRQAPRQLRAQLRHLDTLPNNTELHAALWDILASQLRLRLNLAPGQIDANSLPTSVPHDLRHELSLWQQRCERARFSPDSSQTPSDTLRSEFRTFLERLDRELKP